MTLELDKETRDELAGARPAEPLFNGRTNFVGHRVRDYVFLQKTHQTNPVSKSKRYIPKFAVNDSQLQAVLLHAAVKYAFRDKPIPPGFVADLDTVTRLAKERHRHDLARVEHSAKWKQQRIYRHLLCVEQAGGYVAFISAVAYRCWRLFWPSAVVATDLQVTQLFVYEVTQMLADYAEELGFPTYPQAPAKGMVPATKGTIKVDRDSILAHRAAGLGIMEISRRVGCSSEAVARVLKMSGLHYSRRVSPAASVRIAALWKEKMRTDEIAKLVGYSVATVRNTLNRLGFSLPNHKGRLKFDHDEILALRAKGLGATEISRRVGCSVGTVWDVLRQVA